MGYDNTNHLLFHSSFYLMDHKIIERTKVVPYSRAHWVTVKKNKPTCWRYPNGMKKRTNVADFSSIRNSFDANTAYHLRTSASEKNEDSSLFITFDWKAFVLRKKRKSFRKLCLDPFIVNNIDCTMMRGLVLLFEKKRQRKFQRK